MWAAMPPGIAWRNALLQLDYPEAASLFLLTGWRGLDLDARLHRLLELVRFHDEISFQANNSLRCHEAAISRRADRAPGLSEPLRRAWRKCLTGRETQPRLTCPFLELPRGTQPVVDARSNPLLQFHDLETALSVLPS